MALGTALEFYTSVENGSKLKVRKCLELISTFLEVAEKQLIKGVFCPRNLNSVNKYTPKLFGTVYLRQIIP